MTTRITTDNITDGTIAQADLAAGVGAVDWQTGDIKTATFTAVSGKGYFCNTAGGQFTVNLPAGSAGAMIALQDYNNTFDSNSLLVTPNGSEKINSGTGNIILDTEGEGLTLIYIDGTVGWRSIEDSSFADIGSTFVSATGGTVTTSGDYKIHTFNSSSNFVVSAISGTAANNNSSYLVVAGGGCGGGYTGGGGGGGGFREGINPADPYAPNKSPLASTTPIALSAQTYPITVGAGGVAHSGGSGQGTRGSNSVFSTITSTGGGSGGGNNSPFSNGPGGSGGGGPEGFTGGTGNTPPVSPAQGYNGGGGSGPGPNNDYREEAGGGGGATQQGGNGTNQGSSPTGNGGNGASTSITGSSVAYSGGGGGGKGAVSPAPSPSVPQGGTGGGGNGSYQATQATAGTANRGGGGGGSGASPSEPAPAYPGKNGGSGIVIIRYKYQ